MGVHSLDQILLGGCLGFLNAFTHHFMIRDHLMIFIEKATKHESQYLPDLSLNSHETMLRN
jgi:hypothetical protein